MMLKLANVSKSFGGLSVLQDVSFDVPPGKVFGLIGPNGAGKTTVFNLITGLLAPTGGTIELQGQNLLGSAPHQITRKGIARTFQNIRIFKDMTLLDNVVVGMHSHLDYGVPGWLFALPGFRAQEQRAREKARELLGWVGLAAKASDTADNLSYGDQRKLELARALATEPKLLLLDEPVAGMTVEETERTAELFLSLEGNHSLVVVEHDMKFIGELTQNGKNGKKVTVLHEGSVLAEGLLSEVQANEKVVEVYLGR
jgi:branched-chain amino acid transport system ATP-binding protein